MASTADVRAHALRLRPGDDLRPWLEAWAADEPVPAAGVVSAVGSLTAANLRLAGADATRTLEGPLEIVSLCGTVGAGGAHLHVAVADAVGRCVGGHVLAGCRVHTTIELVLLELGGLAFARSFDPATGFPELDVG
ncbi:MAG: PPC domain-containing DNA-binding protein [Myxococcota bacterium]